MSGLSEEDNEISNAHSPPHVGSEKNALFAMPRANSLIDRTKRISDLCKEHFELIKFISTVFAAVYAFVEYKERDYIERVKTATEVIEQFNSSDEYQSLVKLQNIHSSTYFSNLRKQLLENKLNSEAYHKEVYSKIIENNRVDFLNALRGLKKISICGIQRRCEPMTLCAFIARTMQDFRCDFRDVIAELSADDGSCVVDEMNHFVDTYCKPWMSMYLGLKYNDIKDNYCIYKKSSDAYLIGDTCRISLIYKHKNSIIDPFF